MGLTYIDVTVSGPEGTADLELLIDSGAGYTLLPETTWRALGLEPKRSERFRLADGSPIERQMAYCEIKLPDGSEGPTPVILGESDDEGLLGVVTLEILGLVFNPFNRSIHRMRMLLMRAS